MPELKCAYEGCPNEAAFLCPQLADDRPCGWVWLPVCAQDRASWWDGGDYTEANCPVPTLSIPTPGHRPTYVVIYDTTINHPEREDEQYYGYFSSPRDAVEQYRDLTRGNESRFFNARLCMQIRPLQDEGD